MATTKHKESIPVVSVVAVGCLTLLLAAFLRLDDLGLHAFHADEAVQGIKSEEFFGTGEFDYDPTEFHGPLPHQAAGVVLGATGRLAADSPQLGEADLRLAPALVGVLVVFVVVEREWVWAR